MEGKGGGGSWFPKQKFTTTPLVISLFLTEINLDKNSKNQLRYLLLRDNAIGLHQYQHALIYH